MSLIEILRTIYEYGARHKPEKPNWPERDVVILSKGHGCLALYAVLADQGYFKLDELDDFGKPISMLGGHPERGKVPGVEASTGALGHGLSIAVGIARAMKMKKTSRKVFVVMGDGEINEGSVWEAAMSASKHQLSNLSVFIDYNKLQSYGEINDVMPLEPLKDKFESFGFEVSEVDGHDTAELRARMDELPFNPLKPSAFICHTIKGRGIPEAKNNPKWHHRSNIPLEEIEALEELLLEG